MRKRLTTLCFIAILIMPSILWFFLKDSMADGAENRVLASKPAFSLSTVWDYPSKYEAYFDDNLPFKNFIVKNATVLEKNIFNSVSSKKVLLGKEDWLFYITANVPELDDEKPIADFQGINLYTDEEMNIFVDRLKRVEEKLANNGVKFVIMVCPNKENIYHELLPQGISRVETPSKAQRLVKCLEENDLKVIFPEKELLEQKDDYQLYYKYDTHWNLLGGYIGEQEILSFLTGEKHKITDYNVWIDEGECPKDLAVMLNAPEIFNDDKMYIVDYKPEITATQIEFSEDGVSNVFTSNSENDTRVMLVRDSYGEAMMNYLSKDFSDSIFVHRNGFDYGFIDVYKPDVVIYEVVERATDDLLDVTTLFQVE